MGNLETKLQAIAHDICKFLWLKHLTEKLGVIRIMLIKMYYNNKAAINISQNLAHCNKTKHMGVDGHFIKEKIEGGIGCIICVHIEQVVNSVSHLSPIFCVNYFPSFYTLFCFFFSSIILYIYRCLYTI